MCTVQSGRNVSGSDKKAMLQRLGALRLTAALGNEEVVYV